MKKFLVTLMTLALLLMLTVASAESVPAINWADVNVESTGIAGTWYTFDNVALKIWVPDIFQNMSKVFSGSLRLQIRRPPFSPRTIRDRKAQRWMT